MDKAELERHYLETTYSVVINEEQYNINVGKPLPPVVHALVSKEKTAAILTAWNPRSNVLSLSENHSRNKNLMSILKDYNVFNSVGQGVDLSWLAEESFFIVGIQQCDVDKLAIEFEQYSYVWCDNSNAASLIFTELWNDEF